MAQLKIPYFYAQPLAGGRTGYFWKPGKDLRAAGWKGLALGQDMAKAVAAAEQRNAEVEAWRTGGAKPKAVAAHIRRHTVADLVAKYKAARFKPVAEGGLAPRTQIEYAAKFKIILKWTTYQGREGATDLAAIDRKRVRVLRDALMTPDENGHVRHTRAHATLRVLRTLLQWAEDEEMIPTGSNPATRTGLKMPQPRDQIWWPPARAAIEQQAEKDGSPSLALAIALAPFLSQRQGDMLKFQHSQYREIPAYKMDRDVYDTLAGMNKAGNVMGISLRQGKTKRWVEVPIVGQLRDRIEAEVRKRKLAGQTTLFIEDERNAPWQGQTGQTRFQRRFLEVKLAAVESHPDLAQDMTDLQFRDYRRTGVVMMGEMGLADHLIAAVTGHSLDETKRILETYMPRTTGMAARAIALSQARSTPAAEKEEKQA